MLLSLRACFKKFFTHINVSLNDILKKLIKTESKVEGLPRSRSKQNQLRTLINMSPGRWYPIRLSRIKGVFQFFFFLAVFQFRPLYWHSSLFGKCVRMHFTGWGSPIKKHTKYYSKSGYWINVWLLLLCWGCAVETIVNIVKDLEK